MTDPSSITYQVGPLFTGYNVLFNPQGTSAPHLYFHPNGPQEMFGDLGDLLYTIIGVDSFSLQPTGSAREYTGLMVIHAYHMQPLGMPIAMTVAVVMAGALGAARSGISLGKSGVDPLTLYMSKFSRSQLNDVMSEFKCVHKTKNRCATAASNNNNNKPSVFLLSGVWGGKMYAVHTSTSDEVERLFPKDPRLKSRDTTQTHSTAQKQMT
ncbi:hypothetical protein FXO37_09509 [Capsicum annuum]|nr:hypothetical protein FXO37_09509 [Capsicum annuum]